MRATETLPGSEAASSSDLVKPLSLDQHFDALAAFPSIPTTYVRPIQASMPFNKAADAFLEAIESPVATSHIQHMSTRTFQDYRKKLKRLRLLFGDTPLDQIHIRMLIDYQRKRAAGAGFTRTKGREVIASPAGAAKINAELNLLRRLMKLGDAWTADLEAFYIPYKIKGADLERALSHEEQERFLFTAQSQPQWHPIYWYSLVALHLTFSTDEMRTIKIGDINLAHQIISVNRRYGKNSYRRREVPICDSACSWAIERLIERAQKLGARSPQHFLFPGRVVRNVFDPETHMSETGLRKQFEEVRSAAGVPWFQLNGWRHTAITRLAEAGVPIAIIMQRSGHVTPRMSAHYTHICEQVQRFAVTGATQKKQTVSVQAMQLRRQLNGY
jgi:integrase